jgi:hypothetical protein
MPEGTLRAILRQAGIEPDDFLKKKKRRRLRKKQSLPKPPSINHLRAIYILMSPLELSCFFNHSDHNYSSNEKQNKNEE